MRYYALAAIAAFALVLSCSKETPIVPEEIADPQELDENTEPASEIITISASIPALTKVAFDPAYEDGKPTKLSLTWKASDKLLVADHANPSSSAEFTITSGVGEKNAVFSGTAPAGATSYDVSIVNGEVGASQLSDGDTSHLQYLASKEDVSDLSNIAFDSFNSILAISAIMPSTEVAAAVKSVYITASENIFNGGNTLNLTLENVGDAGSDAILHFYTTLPVGNQAITAGTSLLVQINTPGEAHAYYTRYIELGAQTITSNKLNNININASRSDTHAGLVTCDGTDASKAYLIADKYQLAAVDALAVAGSVRYFKLIDDIDLDGFSWTSLNADPYTKGVNFDGNGKTISHLGAPLFDDLNGSVRNLTIDGATLTSGSGILANSIKGAGSVIAVDVTDGSITGESYIGGLVGRAGTGASIENCSCTGTVSGQYYVGGIAGALEGNGVITACSNKATISALKDTGGNNKESYAAAGGIVGLMDGSATVEQCYNHGNVSSTYAMAGGIAGMMLGGTVDCCYAGKGDNKAQIKAQFYSGGIVGVMKNGASAVVNCAASATVGAPNNYGIAGGIAGDVMSGATLANCVAMAAKVWGYNNANSKVGAVVGVIEGGASTVHNCYSQANNTSLVGYSTDGGTVTSGGNIKRGGVFGNFYTGNVKDCYYTAGGPGAGTESTATPRNKTGNFKQITNNAKNGTADDSFSNFANGQTGGTMYLKEALTKGATGVKYNNVDLSSWEGKKSGSEQAYPSVLVALGANYCD